MIDGKPAIVLSYSMSRRDQVAKPVAGALERYGFRAVLIGDEPLPPGVDSNPNSKVEWFFRHAVMAVFLATADDRLESGEVHTRPNIVDEHRLGQQLPHLQHRLMVFKAREVDLPSNINPVYENLPLDDPDWIVAKVIDQARTWGVLPARDPTDGGGSPQSSDAAAAAPPVAGIDEVDATEQAVNALTTATEALHVDGIEVSDLRRAELAIASLLADKGGGDTLGVHLANRLFGQRREIRLRPSERGLLLRTYLAHAQENNVPGCVWFQDLSRREVVDLLLNLAETDGDDHVRAHALLMLGRLGRPQRTTEARRLVHPFLVSGEHTLRTAGIKYLQHRRDGQLRDLLDQPSLLERDRHRASQAAALLDLPRRPGEVLQRYVADAYVRASEVESALLSAAARVGRRHVEDALRSSDLKVLGLGLRLAVAKRMPLRPRANELLKTTRLPKGRSLVVRALIEAGEAVDLATLRHATETRDDDLNEFGGYDEQRELELGVCLRLPRDELVAGLRWSSITAPNVYEALGRRDEAWARAHVRRDLANDFARLQKAEREGWLAELLKAAEDSVGRSLTPDERHVVDEAVDKRAVFAPNDKVGRFVLRSFRRAALRVLVCQGKPSDVRIARRFADDPDEDLRVEALRLFERFGTSHDAMTVLGLVDRVYAKESQRQAAELALRLAYKKDKLKVLEQCRQHHATRTWSVERLGEATGGFSVAWGLLRDDDATIRRGAADVVWSDVRPDAAEKALDFYMSDWHFYNVVCAVDRRLYAPDWLRQALPASS